MFVILCFGVKIKKRGFELRVVMKYFVFKIKVIRMLRKMKKIDIEV